MARLDFTIPGEPGVNVGVEEIDGGKLSFNVSLNESENVGDLRGLFFDVADGSLIGGLSASGPNLTDQLFDDDTVRDLGNGANVNGLATSPFDVGIELGTQGIGKDDIQETSFILSHSSTELTLETIAEQNFAARITSVGPEDGDREESLKLEGTAPPASKLPTIGDVVLVQDLSGSFGDDLPNVQAQFGGLYDTLNADGRDIDFGVASFVDKPVSPFGSAEAGDYPYQTDAPVNGDKPTIQTALDSLIIRYGVDGPESQLEALLQVALREGEIGYRADVPRFAVLFTDATAHVAGDYSSAPPNDLDTDVTEMEDYPSIAQVGDALEAGGITPIFATTSDVMPFYQNMVDTWGFGAVTELTSDSSNVADAVIAGLEGASSSSAAEAMRTVEIEDTPIVSPDNILIA